jgi:hypothetical protein
MGGIPAVQDKYAATRKGKVLISYGESNTQHTITTNQFSPVIVALASYDLSTGGGFGSQKDMVMYEVYEI